MKASTLIDLTVEELRSKIQEEIKVLANYKLNHSVSPLENPLVIKSTRVNIARLKTELNKRSSN